MVERGVGRLKNSADARSKEVKSDPDVYFELLADMDLTEHFGGAAATRELAELCKMERSVYVLDVGSGVGFTPTNLAKEVGCRVVGADFQKRTIEYRGYGIFAGRKLQTRM
jgi:2-polyprenyl-3-methyl-5-hydroxy-6-metoxy-1,4-benzoquinol methylase